MPSRADFTFFTPTPYQLRTKAVPTPYQHRSFRNGGDMACVWVKYLDGTVLLKCQLGMKRFHAFTPPVRRSI